MIKEIVQSQPLNEQIPIQEMASPAEVAQAVLFLAQQGNITGEVLNTNGGMLMKS